MWQTPMVRGQSISLHALPKLTKINWHTWWPRVHKDLQAKKILLYCDPEAAPHAINNRRANIPEVLESGR